MINTDCAICGNNKNSSLLYEENFSLKNIGKKTFSARRLPDKIHYRMVRCNKCGLVYANPRLPLSIIENLYKKSTYTYEKYENDLIATYSKYLKKYLPNLKEHKRILDIGCGNGFFLNYAKKLGFEETWGVEPGKETVQKADNKLKRYIVTDIFKKGQFKKNYFDLICLFQVFDHIPDPNSFLSECYKILKKGGGILCINHNVQSISAKILKDKSPIIDIEHTYLFNKDTLPKIYKQNGFRVVSVFEVINRYPLKYWFRMFPFPPNVKKKLMQALNYLNIQDTKIWLPPGNIGIFVLKR